MYKHIYEFLNINVHDLWRIRKTCFEILADRGYTITAEDLSFFPQEEETFKEWVSDKLKERKEDMLEEMTQLALLKRTVAAKKKHLRKALVEEKLTEEEHRRQAEQVTLQYQAEAKQYNRCFEKLLTIRATRQRRSIMILFIKDEKLTQKSVTDCIDYRTKSRVYDLMLVSKYGHTSAIQHYLVEFKEKTIRSWKHEELLFNYSHHIYVPKHVGMTQSEKTKFLQKHHLVPKNLPELKREDPMVKYHHFYPNQAVRIIRHSETAGFFTSVSIVK